jgi:glycosyltransferase involved in cell wall biosynthesis
MGDISPIRILRVIARLNIGGPAIQAISLSHNLSKDRYESLLVCGRVSPHEGDMSYLSETKGVQPQVLPDLGRELSFLGDFKSYGRLRDIVKEFNPHIIHTHTAKAGTLGRLVGMRLNLGRRPAERIRLVHTFHGHVFHSYFGSAKTRFFIRVERFLAKFTDRIIVISPLQYHDICTKFRIAKSEKVSVIPLGFELSSLGNVNEDRKKAREEYLGQSCEHIMVITIVGRLTHVKNHRMFLDAVRYLKNQGKGDSFKFLIVGDGELRKELMAHSTSLGIDGSVMFTGWQRDMHRIYGATDVITLTSLNEGTPVTLIEGMAAGRPVVATDVGGVRDLLGEVDNGTGDGYKLAKHGILVPSGNAEALAEALLFVSENRAVAQTMVDHAKEFVLARYSLERLVSDMEALYSDLLNN